MVKTSTCLARGSGKLVLGCWVVGVNGVSGGWWGLEEVDGRWGGRVEGESDLTVVELAEAAHANADRNQRRAEKDCKL